MKKILILILFFLIHGCNKPKTVLICGDHVCVNKSEANQYFENNLSIEVKIINAKKNEKVDLVELNLNDNKIDNKKINITKKKNTNKKIKILSKKEVKIIKKEIKLNKNKKNNERKIKKQNNKKKIVKKILGKKNNTSQSDKKIKNIESIRNYDKSNKDTFDVCTILEKCSIDEISKYLLKEGKKRSFPDITTRQ